MTFADYQFYINDYLQGDEPLIPEKSFMRWAEKASNRINKFNVPDSIVADKLKTISEETYNNLKICTCEIAEALYKDMQTRRIGEWRSYSNQGLTKTFADQTIKPEELKGNIRTIINDRISSTELQNIFVFSGR